MRKTVIAVILALVIALGLAPYAIALTDGIPASVEGATINKIDVQNDKDGVPYFQLEIKFPQSFMDLSQQHPADGYTWIDYFWKIDDGTWEPLDGGMTDTILDPSYGFAVSGQTNTYNVPYIYPKDEGTANKIVIKDHTYTLKVQLSYGYPTESSGVVFVYSGFSNELSISSGSFYKDISEWAKPELQKANDLGLIPDILIGADMTKPITREEFCELAVRLYEKVTNKSCEPTSPNPFTDTINMQILKAFKLGITTGTSATTFSPNELINREQCAAMLFRAIKAMKPNADFGVAGVKDFPDQSDISGWAVEATKYMYKMGIIGGDSSGKFMPRATTTEQEASGYGMAAREQAIALSVRTYEKVPSIS